MKILLIVQKLCFETPSTASKLFIIALMEQVKPIFMEKYEYENWAMAKISFFGLFRLSRFRRKDQDSKFSLNSLPQV